MARLKYRGTYPMEIPNVGVVQPGEEFDAPDNLAGQLLERAEFQRADMKRKAQPED